MLAAVDLTIFIEWCTGSVSFAPNAMFVERMIAQRHTHHSRLADVKCWANDPKRRTDGLLDPHHSHCILRSRCIQTVRRKRRSWMRWCRCSHYVYQFTETKNSQSHTYVPRSTYACVRLLFPASKSVGVCRCQCGVHDHVATIFRLNRKQMAKHQIEFVRM